jgi:glutamine amidotransferase
VIAIVDYGMGNLHSVRHALDRAGAEAAISAAPEALRAADRIVLPGVGAFGECAARLRATGLIEALEEEVLKRGKPMLGICVGMQLLAETGSELGSHAGLGWMPGTVDRLAPDVRDLKVPHVGWNEVAWTRETPMSKGLSKSPHFYFVHSYRLFPREAALIAAECDYGGAFPAAVQFRNVFATQFHPEKSQDAGLRLLENFLSWSP